MDYLKHKCKSAGYGMIFFCCSVNTLTLRVASTVELFIWLCLKTENASWLSAMLWFSLKVNILHYFSTHWLQTFHLQSSKFPSGHIKWTFKFTCTSQSIHTSMSFQNPAASNNCYTLSPPHTHSHSHSSALGYNFCFVDFSFYWSV